MNVTHDGVNTPPQVLNELDVEVGPEKVINPPEASRNYSSFFPPSHGNDYKVSMLDTN
jgi:hypothetical protein